MLIRGNLVPSFQRTRNGTRQQTLQFLEVAYFCPNVVEVVRGDFANPTAGRFLRSAEPKQGADLVKREAKLARPPYENENAKVGPAIHATAACGARRRNQHLDPLVVADGFDFDATAFCKLANQERLRLAKL